MTITRRDVLQRAGKAVVITAAALTAGVGTTPAKALQPGPLCEGVQALVNEIRRDLAGNMTVGDFWTLQEAADRLEALPGIQPVANEQWQRWKPRMPSMARSRLCVVDGVQSKEWRMLRPPLGRGL